MEDAEAFCGKCGAKSAPAAAQAGRIDFKSKKFITYASAAVVALGLIGAGIAFGNSAEEPPPNAPASVATPTRPAVSRAVSRAPEKSLLDLEAGKEAEEPVEGPDNSASLEREAEELTREIDELTGKLPQVERDIEDMRAKVAELQAAVEDKETTLENYPYADPTVTQGEDYQRYSAMSAKQLIAVKADALKAERAALLAELSDRIGNLDEVMSSPEKVAEDNKEFSYDYGAAGIDVAGEVFDAVGEVFDAVGEVADVMDKLQTVEDVVNAIGEYGSFPAETVNYLADTIDSVSDSLSGKKVTAANVDDVMSDFAELINAYDDIKEMSNGRLSVSIDSDATWVRNTNELYDRYIYTITAAESLAAFGG
jgi:methyl-accepting chemotaxis protein